MEQRLDLVFVFVCAGRAAATASAGLQLVFSSVGAARRRQLATQIGCAFGFVRLVRCGGRRCARGTLQLVPDLAQPAEFGAAAEATALSEPDRSTAATVDACPADLAADGHYNTAFFRLLLGALAPALRYTLPSRAAPPARVPRGRWTPACDRRAWGRARPAAGCPVRATPFPLGGPRRLGVPTTT